MDRINQPVCSELLVDSHNEHFLTYSYSGKQDAYVCVLTLDVKIKMKEKIFIYKTNFGISYVSLEVSTNVALQLAAIYIVFILYFRYVGEQHFCICANQICLVLALCFASVGTTADNGGESSIPFFVPGFCLAAIVSQLSSYECTV